MPAQSKDSKQKESCSLSIDRATRFVRATDRQMAPQPITGTFRTVRSAEQHDCSPTAGVGFERSLAVHNALPRAELSLDCRIGVPR